MVQVINHSNIIRCSVCNSWLSYEAEDMVHDESRIPDTQASYLIIDSIQCPTCKTWILVNSRHEIKRPE